MSSLVSFVSACMFKLQTFLWQSSLLQVILGELPPTEGKISLGGASVSYASQEPWLFVASIRQNILFGLPYYKTRYKKVSCLFVEADKDCNFYKKLFFIAWLKKTKTQLSLKLLNNVISNFEKGVNFSMFFLYLSQIKVIR